MPAQPIGGITKNDNLSLCVVPFGVATSSIAVARLENLSVGISVPVNGLNSNTLNFVSAYANVLGGARDSKGVYSWQNGVWGQCTNINALVVKSVYDADGGVRFFDSFGNQGQLIFRRQGFEYALK